MHPVAIGEMIYGRGHDVPSVLLQGQIQLGHGNDRVIRGILDKIIEVGRNLVSEAQHVILLPGNGLGVRVNILNQRASSPCTIPLFFCPAGRFPPASTGNKAWKKSFRPCPPARGPLSNHPECADKERCF